MCASDQRWARVRSWRMMRVMDVALLLVAGVLLGVAALVSLTPALYSRAGAARERRWRRRGLDERSVRSRRLESDRSRWLVGGVLALCAIAALVAAFN